MKNKVLRGFSLVMIAVICLSFAGTGIVCATDGDFVIENGVLIKYHGSGGDITIPNSVTSIGETAFKACTSLTSITIPNSITSIGKYTFASCIRLTIVTISNSITSISDRAFYNCKSLTNVTIPNSVASIGNAAFYNCESLTSVIIPNSVISIGDDAFYACISLTNIIIPNSVTSIGNRAFYWCPSLTSVTIPNSVTSIGNYTFSSCTSLTSVTIPNSATSIGNDTFKFCESLTNVTIPNSVTSIGDRAFYNCESLTSVTISNSVTSIGNWTFASCPSLTIYGLAGSYAEEYANKKEIPFESMSEFESFEDQSLSSTESDGDFKDINASDWFYDAVGYAYDEGLMNGVGDDLFAPYGNLTRAMLVTTLYRYEVEPDITSENIFTDVPAGQWYTNAVIWANANGIVEGYGDGIFGTEDNITREQLAAVFYRYGLKKGFVPDDYSAEAIHRMNLLRASGEISDEDYNEISDWAREASVWSISKSIIPRRDNSFVAKGDANRAEVAAVFYNLQGLAK